MVNKPLIRPAISGGGGTWPGGDWLNSHNFLDLRATPTVEILNGETGGEFSHQSFSCDSVGISSPLATWEIRAIRNTQLHNRSNHCQL